MSGNLIKIIFVSDPVIKTFFYSILFDHMMLRNASYAMDFNYWTKFNRDLPPLTLINNSIIIK